MSDGNAGKVNVYTCANGHRTWTRDAVNGTTPAMIACPEDGCTAGAQSSWYQVDSYTAAHVNVTHEWYRPEGIVRLSRDEREHVAAGGLLLRRMSTGDRKVVTSGPFKGRVYVRNERGQWVRE